MQDSQPIVNRGKKIGWTFFFFIALSEFLLFKHFVLTEVSNFYPFGFDQASYLPLLYLTLENVKKYGVIAGILQSPSLPTGFLFPIQSVLFFLLFGASRWSILLVNFIYFLILQFCCLHLIRKLSTKNYFFMFFLGILLLINTPFVRAGGNLFDVRIDFMAFCLYGIFVCTVIKSEFFFQRKWVWIAGVVACFLILLRTITSVYIGGIGVGLFCYFLLKKLISSSTKIQQVTHIRLVNLIIFGALILMITLPFIWFTREALYNYYMIGHVLGQERLIRAAQAGITNFASIIKYYPHMLLYYHIGLLAFYFCFFLISFYFFFYLRLLRKGLFSQLSNSHHLSIPTMNGNWDAGFVFLFLAILVPMIALTLDMNKSPVVASIMVIPTIWLVLWCCFYIDAKLLLTSWANKILNYLAFIVLLVGIIHQVDCYHSHLSQKRYDDLAMVNKMYMDIGHYAEVKKWSTINIGFDQIVDYLTSGGMEAVYYEKTGKLLNFSVNPLGGSIFAISKQAALINLQKSQIFIINLGQYKNHEPYPYHQSILQLKPMLKNYAEQHFSQLGDYAFMNSTYRVYVAKN